MSGPPFRSVPMALACLVAICLLPPPPAGAQPPSADWRTLDLPRFRVHYPAPFETWALRFAGRLEAVRDRLVDEIGGGDMAVVDVIVADPEATSNGYVLPVLGAPRMVVWPTPPPPDSLIGHYRDWGELLAVHEDAHLVQLLRPSRNPALALLARVLVPVGPITTQAPRWVIEGYATLIEGELTGMGRPSSDLRAAVLRRWAQQGRLPSYAQLSGAPDRWLGMSMAYLAGSAYLEWLRERAGPDSFRHLWARMTAHTVRTFDEAFEGVYGESPAALYGRFAAELARDALEVEAIVEPARRDGALWQRFVWSTGVPAVSPDGRLLAVVRRGREQPARVVVLRTGPDPDSETRRERRLEEMIARDPQDVAPVIVAPPAREPVHVLPAMDGAEPYWPRWMPDGASMLFVRFEPDRDGVLHPDVYEWHVAGGHVRRVTREAGLRQPDPAPDGAWAVAVRHRFGLSQLVRVDLRSGAVQAMTEARADVALDSPRISADGQRVVFLRNAGDGWRAIVRHLEEGSERELPVPDGTLVAHPAWSADGAAIYLSIGHNGFVDVHAVPADGETPPRAVTRSHGAALGAAPAPDGALYFLSLESHGVDLRILDEVQEVPARRDLPDRLIAVVPPESPDPIAWPAKAAAPGRPVRVGRQEWLPLIGGASSPGSRAFELGLRGGDVLGRLTTLGMVSVTRGQRSPAGATFGVGWRGWPALTLSAGAFSLRETPSRQPVAAPAAGDVFDLRRRGGEAALEWRRHGRPREWGVAGGMLAARVTPVADEAVSQAIGFGRVVLRAHHGRDRWHLLYGARLRGEAARTGADAWQRSTLVADAGVGHGRQALVTTVERRALHGSPAPFDRLLVGGMPSSVLPDGVAAGRRFAPALPLGTLVGDHHRAVRVEWRQAGSPFLAWERHQTRDRAGAWSAPVSWLSAEVHLGGGPFPLLRLPGVEARAGVARLLGPRTGPRVRWWLGLRWFP